MTVSPHLYPPYEFVPYQTLLSFRTRLNLLIKHIIITIFVIRAFSSAYLPVKFKFWEEVVYFADGCYMKMAIFVINQSLNIDHSLQGRLNDICMLLS